MVIHEESDEFLDRKMREYKLRTAYGGLAKRSRHNRSDGYYSTDETNNHTARSHDTHYHTPRHDAHDKSHAKLDLPDPLYHQHGRVTKNYNRTKKSNPPQTEKQYIYSTKSPVPTTKDKGCCCCCTIL